MCVCASCMFVCVCVSMFVCRCIFVPTGCALSILECLARSKGHLGANRKPDPWRSVHMCRAGCDNLVGALLFSRMCLSVFVCKE